MRILLANDHATPMGGAEIAVARLRDGLRARGHEVQTLATTATSLPVAPDAEHLARGTLHPRGRVMLETCNPWAARAMTTALRAFRPHVVHLRLMLTQLSPLVLRPLANTPAVHQIVMYKPICPKGTRLLPDGALCPHRAGPVCVREGCITLAAAPFAQLQRSLYRRWVDRLDAVTTLSHAAAAVLAEQGVAGPIEVIPNGVDPRPARPPLSGPPVVGFAGRLVPEKGPDVLLEAFARLAAGDHPDARLLLLGDGPLREPLRRRAAALGLHDRVELPGHLTRADAERRLDGVWVQAIPGRWVEPFGTVTLEAAVRGTPVVASTIGGPGEVVRQAGLGATTPPGDPDALAGALAPFLTDAGHAERVGAGARRAVLEGWTHDRVLDRFESLYERLRGRAPAGPDDRARPRSRA